MVKAQAWDMHSCRRLALRPAFHVHHEGIERLGRFSARVALVIVLVTLVPGVIAPGVIREIIVVSNPFARRALEPKHVVVMLALDVSFRSCITNNPPNIQAHHGPAPIPTRGSTHSSCTFETRGETRVSTRGTVDPPNENPEVRG